jgi:hypothetical protein
VAKEYVACQPDEDIPGDEGPGALVLSEFAGAAEELFNALLVNPYDAAAVADAVGRALAMPVGERRARMSAMRRRVMSFDARAWARAFAGDLAATPADQPAAAAADGDLPAVRERLRGPSRRAGGCAVPRLRRDAAGTGPRPGRRRPHRRNCAPCSTGSVAAERRRDDHLRADAGRPRAVRRRYERFGLVAEHGAAAVGLGAARVGATRRGRRAYSWKEPIRKVLQFLRGIDPGDARRGEGDRVRVALPPGGPESATEGAGARHGAVQRGCERAVTFRHGRKIVEVAPAHVSKGSAVAQLLAGRAYDADPHRRR